jgi:hypothetical protein
MVKLVTVCRYGILKLVLTYTGASVFSSWNMGAHVVELCPDGWDLDVFPHLVQGHCADQAVLYGTWEQVGGGLLDKHTHDVASGAVVGRRTALISV